MGRSQSAGGGAREWGGAREPGAEPESLGRSQRVGRSQKTGGGGRELGTVSRRDGRFLPGGLPGGGQPGSAPAGEARALCVQPRPEQVRCPTPAPLLPCRVRTGSRGRGPAVTSGRFRHCPCPRLWATPCSSSSAPASPPRQAVVLVSSSSPAPQPPQLLTPVVTQRVEGPCSLPVSVSPPES